MSIQQQFKSIPVLAAVLCVQCLLLAVLWLRPSSASLHEPAPLLASSVDSVHRVQIDAGGAFELTRKGDGWYIDNLVPADDTKVARLLDKLANSQVDWAVGRSTDAADRFTVAEDKFQRKVQIFSDTESPETVYFGTSPGFNRVHVRRGGERDIYALQMNIQDVPGSKDSWLKTDLLQPQGELRAINSGSIELHKSEQQWQVRSDRAVEAAELDAEAVAKVLSELRVIGIAEDIASLSALEQSQVKDSFTFEVATGERQWQYHFAEYRGQYYVQRSDIEVPFRIGKAQFDALAKLSNMT